MIKSPLNYMGGKHRILNQILPLFPKKISTFVEPFCGGFNVGVNINSEKIIAMDINKYLIELLDFFSKSKIEKLLFQISKIISEYNLNLENIEGYLKLRNDYNKNKEPIFLFVLTCFSFNHQIRFNNSFQYNVPFGKNRSTYNKSIEINLIEFCNKLKDKKPLFITSDFNHFNYDKLDKNSFVYCDPPYYISNGSYNDGKRGFGDWTKKNEEILLILLDELNQMKIKFALSNVLNHKGLANPKLIEWSKKYKIHKINNNFNNSNYQSKAKMFETTEVLITNY